jgi:hypothetical protein
MTRSRREGDGESFPMRMRAPNAADCGSSSSPIALHTFLMNPAQEKEEREREGERRSKTKGNGDREAERQRDREIGERGRDGEREGKKVNSEIGALGATRSLSSKLHEKASPVSLSPAFSSSSQSLAAVKKEREMMAYAFRLRGRGSDGRSRRSTPSGSPCSLRRYLGAPSCPGSTRRRRLVHTLQGGASGQKRDEDRKFVPSFERREKRGAKERAWVRRKNHTRKKNIPSERIPRNRETLCV